MSESVLFRVVRCGRCSPQVPMNTGTASLLLHRHFGVSLLQLTRPYVLEVRMLVRKLFPPRPSVRVPLLRRTTHCGWINVKDAREHMQSFRQEWPK